MTTEKKPAGDLSTGNAFDLSVRRPSMGVQLERAAARSRSAAQAMARKAGAPGGLFGITYNPQAPFVANARSSEEQLHRSDAIRRGGL